MTHFSWPMSARATKQGFTKVEETEWADYREDQSLGCKCRRFCCGFCTMPSFSDAVSKGESLFKEIWGFLLAAVLTC